MNSKKIISLIGSVVLLLACLIGSTDLVQAKEKGSNVINQAADPKLFRRDAYLLTASGRELFSVIHNGEDFESDEEYAVLCLKDMKEENPEFYVGAFPIVSGGSSTDLLEED